LCSWVVPWHEKEGWLALFFRANAQPRSLRRLSCIAWSFLLSDIGIPFLKNTTTKNITKVKILVKALLSETFLNGKVAHRVSLLTAQLSDDIVETGSNLAEASKI